MVSCIVQALYHISLQKLALVTHQSVLCGVCCSAKLSFPKQILVLIICYLLLFVVDLVAACLQVSVWSRTQNINLFIFQLCTTLFCCLETAVLGIKLPCQTLFTNWQFCFMLTPCNHTLALMTSLNIKCIYNKLLWISC